MMMNILKAYDYFQKDSFIGYQELLLDDLCYHLKYNAYFINFFKDNINYKSEYYNIELGRNNGECQLYIITLNSTKDIIFYNVKEFDSNECIKQIN